MASVKEKVLRKYQVRNKKMKQSSGKKKKQLSGKQTKQLISKKQRRLRAATKNSDRRWR